MIDKSYQNYTRILTVEDLDSILEIMKDKTTISKIEKENNIEVSRQATKDCLENENYRLIGYFENNNLVSYLVQKLSTRLSAWNMIMLATNSKYVWNYKKNGLEYCWANAMDYAENLGIYKIYWSLPSKWARTQRKTYMTTDVWYRYNIYIEDVIPPNQFPKWDEYKAAFGNKLKPHEVTIKLAMLKNEYRPFVIT